MKYLFGLLLWVVSATSIAAEADNPYGQVHHDLTVILDPATREFRAEDSITVTGKGKLTFALGLEFALKNLSLNNRGVTAELNPSPQEGLSWRSVELGDQVSTHLLKLAYQGKLASLDASLDHRQVLERLPAMAGNTGSYLPAASAWYPLIEGAEFFTYQVTLDLPDDQRGLVPGRLVNEQINAGRYRAQFKFTHPAAGMDLLAGPYQVKELIYSDDNAKRLRLRTYFHPQITDLASDYLDSISAYIELYNDWIGSYPFSEFSIVSSPIPTGFGLPTLTYLGIDVLRLPFIRFGSLGHEILHNWWANGVYVDWQSGNWSEGLTTFMADYTYTERSGEDAAREMRLSWLRDFAAIPPGQDQSLREFTSRTHSASEFIGYHKSAFVFLMLRDLLGTKTFNAGIQRFWKEHQFRTASWNDLRLAFEASSGRKLDNYFKQWLARTGAPKIELEQARLAPHQGGEQPYRLTFTLMQTKPAYTLRVPMVITTNAGKQEHIVELAKSRAEYVIESSARPLSVVIDPNFRLFRQLDPAEIPPIVRQVVTDPATLVAIAIEDEESRKTARQLAGEMLDNPPRFLDINAQEKNSNAPLLLIGTHKKVDLFLAQQRLPPRPAELNDKGTAQVWARQQPNGKVIVVVSAENASALQALLRPLPHYGKESFLVFDNNKLIDKGIWPTHGSAWVLSNHP